MNTSLQRVALRRGALYLPGPLSPDLTPVSTALTALLADHGYAVDEQALHAMNALNEQDAEALAAAIREIFGSGLNWASLINNWTVPAGATWTDYILAYYANLLPEGSVNGTTLPCGHIIPQGLFDLSRYNGCPVCGRPFVTAPGEILTGSGEIRKVLVRFTDDDMKRMMRQIIESPLPPEPSDLDSLRTLVEAYGVPADCRAATDECAVALSAALFGSGHTEAALAMLASAPELLRMLWYGATGYLRVVRPSALGAKAPRLHYSRSQCSAVAEWFESLGIPADTIAASMHPHRGMWVRLIRALRLTEYARRRNYDRLQAILDVFYRSNYEVWGGILEKARLAGDSALVLAMLGERPGLFARSLFATMLTCGAADTLAAFASVTQQLPLRLLVSLASSAEDYFMSYDNRRVVTLADGRRVEAPVNPHLNNMSVEERADMAAAVKEVVIDAIRARYEKTGTHSGSIYIAPELFDIPMPVGDRGSAVSDAGSALQGERFKVKGDKVRLFLQWGEGLPAQPLDMDLSAILIRGDGSTEECAYYDLQKPGAIHSGDIREIPDYTGTAEYVELDIAALREAGFIYAAFISNAYSCRTLSPNLKVGWMSSEHPMKVDNATGVAYDPSTVDRIVRIPDRDIARGLIFGVLDTEMREIIWLEMPNDTQRADMVDAADITAFMRKLRSKMSIGELLAIYADATGMERTDNPEAASECFTIDRVHDIPAVAAILL